jgi:hypothetical protein
MTFGLFPMLVMVFGAAPIAMILLPALIVGF